MNTWQEDDKSEDIYSINIHNILTILNINSYIRWARTIMK